MLGLLDAAVAQGDFPIGEAEPLRAMAHDDERPADRKALDRRTQGIGREPAGRVDGDALTPVE